MPLRQPDMATFSIHVVAAALSALLAAGDGQVSATAMADTSRDYDSTDWNDLEAFAAEFGRRVADAVV